MLLHAIERRTVEIGRDTPTNCSRWKVGRGGKSRAFKSPFKSAAINPWSEGMEEWLEISVPLILIRTPDYES